MGLVTRRNGRGSGYLAQGSSCLALDQAKPLMGRSRLEIMWQCVREPQEAMSQKQRAWYPFSSGGVPGGKRESQFSPSSPHPPGRFSASS